MAKKKSANLALGPVFKFVALAMGLVVIAFAFLNVVSFTIDFIATSTTTSYTGFQAIFGYSVSKEVLGSTVTTTYLGFSIMNLLAYLLPLAGGILMMFKNKFMNLIGTLLFVVGTVFLFLVPNFTVTEYYANATRALGVGAILSAVASILGTLASGVVVYTGMKK